MTNKRNSWDLRLRIEDMHSRSSFFVTLTYNNDNLPADGQVSKSDLHKFLQDFRNHFGPYRYYAVAEYGEHTGRPHYHILMFFNSDDHCNVIRCVNRCWNKGFNDVGDLTNASIHYVTKWHILPKKPVRGFSKEMHGFTRMSKGIGRQLLSNLSIDNIKPTYALSGKRFPIDRYYRKKIGYDVQSVTDIFTYVKRKFDLLTDQQVFDKINDLQSIYSAKLQNPRHSIF